MTSIFIFYGRRQEGAFTPKNPPPKEDEENENKYRLRDTDKRLKRLTKEKKQSEDKPLSLRSLRHKRRNGKICLKFYSYLELFQVSAACSALNTLVCDGCIKVYN